MRFEPVVPNCSEVIYEDRSIRVRSLPLIHRVPCSGFLFEEKPGQLHLRGDMVKFYDIPVYRRAEIKAGADYTTPDGQTIPNDRLTTPADPPLRYAYCSDTAYNEALIPLIEGADCLYHEATFGDDAEELARLTCHSTARQAARIARAASVKQLVLGHFSARYEDEQPLCDEASQEFTPCTLAREGMKIVLGR